MVDALVMQVDVILILCFAQLLVVLFGLVFNCNYLMYRKEIIHSLIHPIHPPNQLLEINLLEQPSKTCVYMCTPSDVLWAYVSTFSLIYFLNNALLQGFKEWLDLPVAAVAIVWPSPLKTFLKKNY